MKKEKILVLFSGGQDSTICLFWALQFTDWEVEAINIEYGQRHTREVIAATKITELAKVPLKKISLNAFEQIGDSALLDKKSDIKKQHRSSDNLPASFVPGRNVIFLSIAAAYAYSKGIKKIITGVCQTDYSGYPDCRDNTIKSLQVTLSLAMNWDFSIETPLMFMSKRDSVFLAQNIPGCMNALAYTHTCYEGVYPPCGECPACKLRQKGFEEAGYKDPLLKGDLL